MPYVKVAKFTTQEMPSMKNVSDLCSRNMLLLSGYMSTYCILV